MYVIIKSVKESTGRKMYQGARLFLVLFVVFMVGYFVTPAAGVSQKPYTT